MRCDTKERESKMATVKTIQVWHVESDSKYNRGWYTRTDEGTGQIPWTEKVGLRLSPDSPAEKIIAKVAAKFGPGYEITVHDHNPLNVKVEKNWSQQGM
jgi:hypothetical protein